MVPLPGKLENLGLFFAAVGAVLLVWGVVTFGFFLRRYPAIKEEAGDAVS